MAREDQETRVVFASPPASPAAPGVPVSVTDNPFPATAEAATESRIEAGGRRPAASPPPLHDFGAERTPSAGERNSIALIQDVDLRVKIELGRTRMYVEDVLQLGEGSVVELDKLAGDPVDVFVNERLVARGEVLVLNDNFCVRVSEIVSEADLRQVG